MSNRGAEYKELKRAFLDSILEVVMDVFPQITREKVTFDPPPAVWKEAAGEA